MMTWGEVQRQALKKLDLPDQAFREEYRPALVQAANEGALLLATAGRPIRRTALVESQGQPLDLTAQAPDLFRLTGADRLEEGEERPTLDYKWEGEQLWLPPGTYRLRYDAYEPQLTLDTPEDHTLSLAPEAQALLPLYIASQLYKHDNVQLAVLWRNEFEMGRELLQLEQRQRGQESGQAAFVAERWF